METGRRMVFALKRACWLFVFLQAIVITMDGQSLFIRDQELRDDLSGRVSYGKPVVRFRLTTDLEYSLTASDLFRVNGQDQGEVNQLSFQQNLRFSTTLAIDPALRITNLFCHNLGLQVYIDSLTRIALDDNTLDTRVEYLAGKRIAFTLLSRLSTRLFNEYDPSPGNAGQPAQILCASFLTPMIWTFSAGITCRPAGWLMLDAGLSSARLTWLRDRKGIERPDAGCCFGVPAGRDHLFEYGLSLHLLIDRILGRWGDWDCDLLIFKNKDRPIDFTLKNLFAVRINRYLKTSILTKLVYEKDVSESLQVENLISLGFYFHL